MTLLLHLDQGVGQTDLACPIANPVSQHGAVAGFPMPVLRYVVGSGLAIDPEPTFDRGTLQLLVPLPDDTLMAGSPAPVFTWQSHPQASLYRLDIETSEGEALLSALVQGPVSGYRAPSWLGERVTGRSARWRVVAIDAAGRELARSDWRSLATR